MSRIKPTTPAKHVTGAVDANLQIGSALATKAYVDEHIRTLQIATLKHAVADKLNTPPPITHAEAGKLYLVDKHPTGAWAGKPNHVALVVPSFTGGDPSWALIPPTDKEERLVESLHAMYQFSAGAAEWVEVQTQVAAASGGPVWFADKDVYHKPFVLPGNWKQINIECQGAVRTQTNDADSRIELIGDTIPALNSVADYGGFWGHSHNDYQYAERTWWVANMLDGKFVKCNYPLGGHRYGSVTRFRWHVLLTNMDTYIMFHSEINGNRRESSSSYQTHYLTEMAFNIAGPALKSIDLSFHGQQMDMGGTYQITAV